MSFTVCGLEAFGPVHQRALYRLEFGRINRPLLSVAAWLHINEDITHRVDGRLLAGEGEGEACGKASVLYAHVVQEVTDALG